ncbi:MAG: T9SS type A sorting domain-containing protein [Bacteroidales bacterium]|nr:T9SS type A sorting domain-containing protein [Bacteroidales bacterium]
MKKTLMVLGFALCASFAFAQTESSVMSNKVIKQTVRVNDNAMDAQKAGFNGSIFTKDGEIFTCDFAENATNYSTGTVGANQMIGGAVATQHTRTTNWSQWRRIADTILTTSIAEDYPCMASHFSNLFQRVTSPTNHNGFMLMSMLEDYVTWGGDGTTGNYDAYIAFAPFSTASENMVTLRFYQWYRAFNNDQCFIDYSTDGTTWNTIEINSEIGSNTNSGTYMTPKSVMLPASAGHQANVYVRIRWTENTDNGGYYWVVDDASVVPAPQYSCHIDDAAYFDGFYQIMPKDMNLPVVWHVDLTNEGQNAQNNVTGSLYTWMDGDANVTTLLSENVGTLDCCLGTKSIIVDPLGYYDGSFPASESGHGWGYIEFPDSVHAMGPNVHLPNTQVGVGHFYGDFTTSVKNHAYENDTAWATFDTMRYLVNWDANYHNGRATWGRDNGALRKFSSWTYGLVAPNVFSNADNGETMWSEAGYGVFVGYAVGDQVPEGWKILGMEIVPSTREGRRSAGAKLIPYLFQDSMLAHPDSTGYRMRLTLDHGAGTYTVQQSDILSGDDYTDLTYLERGDYPTIFIPFPNQPSIHAKKVYRVGFRLAEENTFAVATQGNYYYSLDDSSAVYFWNEPGMQSYGHCATVRTNPYTVQTLDPYDNGFHTFVVDEFPMIRMVVGPGFYVQKHTLSFECGPNGSFQDGDYNDLCGTSDTTIADGAVASYYIMPAEGYDIDVVYLDGVALTAGTDYEVYEDADGAQYGIISLENVTADHTLRCTFKVHVGFDPIAGVSMKLQPNPATSNVNITLKGVTGSVDMALIDMSGRVITTSTFNAENGTNINVSNLAKGAYFVRIVNDKFSKVEKLIVR